MTASPAEAELCTVEALFTETGTAYVIPIYQRNYSWRQEQIDQLVDDVWAAAQDDAQPHYFLGNLVVAEREREDGQAVRELEVIDGQQRLTTLSLLRAALTEADWLPGDRLHYASRPKATTALSTLHSSEDEDGTGIHTAYKIVQQALEARVGDEGKQRRFAKFLRDHVQLVRATLTRDIDLNHYFEIMNTRGQQLQQVDIVKARLLRHLPDDPAAQDCFAWIWDACAAMDVYVQMSLTPGDRDLRSDVFGAEGDRLVARDFSRLQELRSRSAAPARTIGTAEEDGRGLQAALRAYCAAAPVEQGVDDEASRFRSPIEFASLLLHVLKVLDRTGTAADDDGGGLDDNKLIKLFGEWLAAGDQPGENPGEKAGERVKAFAAELLRCRFVLDNAVLKREYTATNGDDGAWSLKRFARSRSSDEKFAYPPAFQAGTDGDQQLDDRTRRILLLQSMLRVTYTSPRTMHWITAVLRMERLEDGVPERADDLEQVLTRYARDRVRRAFFDVVEQPTGFAIERIVFTYLDYLLAKDTDPGSVFTFRNSVEHFFPQHPDRQQARDVASPDGLDDFGNLALISVGANSQFSNALPEFKIRLEKLIAQSPKLQRMADVARRGDWDDAAITAHGDAMVARLRSDIMTGA